MGELVQQMTDLGVDVGDGLAGNEVLHRRDDTVQGTPERGRDGELIEDMLYGVLDGRAQIDALDLVDELVHRRPDGIGQGGRGQDSLSRLTERIDVTGHPGGHLLDTEAVDRM